MISMPSYEHVGPSSISDPATGRPAYSAALIFNSELSINGYLKIPGEGVVTRTTRWSVTGWRDLSNHKFKDQRGGVNAEARRSTTYGRSFI